MHALSSLGSRTFTNSCPPIAQQSCGIKRCVFKGTHQLTPQLQQQLSTSNRLSTSSNERIENPATARRPSLIVQCSRAGQGDSDYQAICRSLAHMSASQLRLAAASSPVLTSSEFLFYLKDLEEQVRKAEQAGRRITAAGQGGPALAEQEAGQAGRTSVTKESSNTAQQEQQPGLHRQQQPAPPLQDDVHNASPQFTVTAEGASGVMNAAVWRPSGASNDNRSSDNSRHDSSSSSSSSDSSSKSSSPNSSNSAASQSLGTLPTSPPLSGSAITAQAVARVAAELVAFREEQELQASSRLLPSLASSLAYDNLLRWRREQQGFDGKTAGSGGGLAVGGIPVEELYKAGEKQERRLKEEQQRRERQQAQQRPTWASSGGVNQDLFGSGDSSNSMASFAERPGNEAFREMANLAMARMRSRLMGYNDESDAAVAVLEALLATGQEWGRAGWADLMHEAFYPPGIKRKSSAASRPSFLPAATPKPASQQQQEPKESQDELVCTSPEALRNAITACIEERRRQNNEDPSIVQLTELLEDLEDYVKHVWLLRDPLERYG